MLVYLLKRLVWFIPTLIIITVLGFVLLVNSPGDPLDTLVNPLTNTHSEALDMELQKNFWRKKLGLDLPFFYFSVIKLSEPDTLIKIYDLQKLKTYKALLKQSGNYKSVSSYLLHLKYTTVFIKEKINKINADTSNQFLISEKEQINTISRSLIALKQEENEDIIKKNLEIIYSNSESVSIDFKLIASNLKNSYSNFLSDKTTYKNYLPKFVWYGCSNRYHHWLFGGKNSKGFISGDFGISYIKKEPIINIIKDKVGLSVLFSVLSIALAYVISIPLGIHMADKPESKKNRVTELVLFMMYSMPSFFVGVLLLMLFANPEILSLFPPSGIKPIGGYDDDASVFAKITDSLPYIVLPLICYTYSSLAFITKLTQTAVSEQLSFDYIKTAKAKGLGDKSVIWKHALKNSLLPLITVFSAIFPSVIGGSIIIESIFTIPGMGLETVKAIGAKDYPIVIAVITISAILTMLSYIVADLLYAWADPRIRYK